MIGENLLQRAQIASLKDKSDWVAVCEQLQAKRDVVVGEIQKGILRGVAFDQRQADYIRGWNAAAEWVTRMPINAAREYKVLKARSER